MKNDKLKELYFYWSVQRVRLEGYGLDWPALKTTATAQLYREADFEGVRQQVKSNQLAVEIWYPGGMDAVDFIGDYLDFWYDLPPDTSLLLGLSLPKGKTTCAAVLATPWSALCLDQIAPNSFHWLGVIELARALSKKAAKAEFLNECKEWVRQRLLDLPPSLVGDIYCQLD